MCNVLFTCSARTARSHCVFNANRSSTEHFRATCATRSPMKSNCLLNLLEGFQWSWLVTSLTALGIWSTDESLLWKTCAVVMSSVTFDRKGISAAQLIYVILSDNYSLITGIDRNSQPCARPQSGIALYLSCTLKYIAIQITFWMTLVWLAGVLLIC